MITNIWNSGDPSEVALSAHIVSLNPDATQEVCDTTQAEQDNQEISTNTAIIPCPSCGSTRLNVVQMPDYCHFAAIRCGHCDTFCQWLSKPKNVETRQRRQTKISQLLKFPHLSQWERKFLEGLRGSKLSPKQQELLARIEMKVGGQR